MNGKDRIRFAAGGRRLLEIGMVAGMIAAFPLGVIGLLAIVGIGLLFAKVVKERLANQEDDHYSKTVQK